MDETPTKKHFEAPKPVTAGDVKEVVIENLSGHGEGIAKIEGFVVFVKGTTRGERCRIRITEVKRTYAMGEKVSPGTKVESAEDMEDETEPFHNGPSG